MDASGRASLAAVKALLAKTYLTMAGFPLSKGASHYTLRRINPLEIITYANANPTVINLFPTYADLRSVSQENKLEQLFEIQYLSSVETKWI